MIRPLCIPNATIRARYFLVALALLGLATAGPVGAFNYVTDANGTWWGIQDAASPRVDTGSIRATQTGPGDCLFKACVTPPYSTSINGFGGIRVLVDTTSAPRMNGEVMRGYGLTFDGVNRFTTTQSIDLGGVTISRSVYINTARTGAAGSTLSPTPRNRRSRSRPHSAASRASAAAGGNSSSIVNTSSGDALVTAADSWVEIATPLAGTTLVGGPQATVIGTPTVPAAPFAGAMTFAGNWLVEPVHQSADIRRA